MRVFSSRGGLGYSSVRAGNAAASGLVGIMVQLLVFSMSGLKDNRLSGESTWGAQWVIM
jgi:hypothetical protein